MEVALAEEDFLDSLHIEEESLSHQGQDIWRKASDILSHKEGVEEVHTFLHRLPEDGGP